MHSTTPFWLWAGFAALIVLMLIIDFVAVRHHPHESVSFKKALTWSCVWISISLLFNGFYWVYLHFSEPATASTRAAEFFTAYLIEKSLSMDNLFVFAGIFSYFKISPAYQKRALTYGVLGAVVMRILIILLGSWLVYKFEWIFYLFGIVLLLTGFHMLKKKEEAGSLEKNRLIQFLTRVLPFTPKHHEEKFVIRQSKRFLFTPLFIAVIFIEVSDLIFAVDSIPAVFGITADPFIVLSSNLLAILGLRSLYFLLAKMIERFHLLHIGLGLILIFISIKMLLLQVIHFPTWLTLSVILITLLAFIGFSLLKPTKNNA